MSRPPVSGESPQPQVHDETCTHPEEQRRTQVIKEPTIYEVCSACEHVMAIRTDRASTGAALDVAAIAEAWGNVMDGRRVEGVRLNPGVTNLDDWLQIAAEYARLAEQEGEEGR